MTVKEIINSDWREKIGKKKVYKALLEIKPLEKYSNLKRVPLEKIEKFLFMCQSKYDVQLSLIYVSNTARDDGFVYTGGISDGSGKILETVHGIELYEVIAKGAIKIWSMIKKGEAKKRKSK